VRRAISAVTATASGMVTSDTTASRGDSHAMRLTLPMTRSIKVRSSLSPSWRVVATLSMSLATRLRMSPDGWPSKYCSGSLASFSSTASRSRYTVRWAMPVMR
jgi:hypothetical protein